MSFPIGTQARTSATLQPAPSAAPKEADAADGLKTLHASGNAGTASARPKLMQACAHLRGGVGEAGKHLESQALKPDASVKSPANQQHALAGIRTGRARFAAVGQSDLKSQAIKTLAAEVRTMTLDQDQKNLVGSFLRGSSPGSALMSRLLKPEFQQSAKKIASAMCNEFESSLKAAGRAPTVADLDGILVKTYQTMLNEMGKVAVSDTFRDVVRSLEGAIDDNVAKTCGRLSPDQHSTIRQTGDMLKNGIVKALFLRVLVPHFSDMFRPNNPNREKTIVSFDKFFDQNPATKSAGMTMMKMSALLLTKINDASGDKQNNLGNTFPKLLKTFKESRLPDLSTLAH